MGESNKRLSPTMQTEIKKIMAGIASSDYESNVYCIEAIFASKFNTELNISYRREIKYVKIIQDFVDNYTDKIIMEMELDVQDYIALYHLRRDLHCTLSFTKFEPQKHVNQADVTPDYQDKYRVILLDNADIFKQITGDRINGMNGVQGDREQLTLRMKMELISEDVYVARKRRLNTVVRKVKMLDMLRYAINFFGFRKARIIKPDNDIEYVNFVIPPDWGVSDIMSFMQNAPGMGVYSNGFCSYITQNCWYVFPRYGDSFTKRVVQIYAVGSTNFEGLNRYNWNEALGDGDFTSHIVVNGEVQERNWSALGTENRINAANVMMDALTFDNSRILKKDGEFEMDPVIKNFASLPSDPMNEDELINLEFKHDRNNMFTISSELGSYQITTLQFIWQKCEPFIFHPGTVVQYNYDHQNAYKSIRGKCERAEYIFRLDESHRLFPTFTGDCQVTLACPNQQAIEDGCV